MKLVASAALLLGSTVFIEPSCTERNHDSTSDPIGSGGNATSGDIAKESVSKSVSTCSARRFQKPTLFGWETVDIPDEECRVRDLIQKGRGKARIAICRPGEVVAETLVPHATHRARLIQANGRDTLVSGDLMSDHGSINGEVGIRFLSEQGTDWIKVSAVDITEGDFLDVMETVLNATAEPRPRRPKGRPWKPIDDSPWDDYMAECWRVRALLSGKDPALASVPRFAQIGEAMAALYAK